MSLLDEFDVEPLREPYVVANTPMFLYREFRDQPTVRALMRKYTIDELVDAWNDYAGRSDRTVDDVARAYAALIALSFAGTEQYEPLRAAIARAHLDLLQWGVSIRDIMLGLRKPLVRATIATRPQAQLSTAARGSGTPTTRGVITSNLRMPASDGLPEGGRIVIIERGKR